MMAQGVMVFADVAQDGLRTIALEMLGAGRRLADALGESLIAAVLGHGIAEAAQEAVYYGADTVYAVDAAAPAHYQTLVYTGVMAQIAQTLVERVKAAATGVRLEDAEIVVSGGRGLQGADDFYGVLEPCAKVLGAAMGASRAAVDEGWVPQQMQVGLTGKIISPKLYIACAISGAAQHMAGCGYAQTIVAVNRDPEAPIYQRATLGVMGDYKKVMPALQKKCEELLQ